MQHLYIYVQPNASKTEFIEELVMDGLKYGISGELKVMKIKIAKQAKDGEANKELISFLAKHFKIPKSSIKLIKGEKSRYKIIQID